MTTRESVGAWEQSCYTLVQYCRHFVKWYSGRGLSRLGEKAIGGVALGVIFVIGAMLASPSAAQDTAEFWPSAESGATLNNITINGAASPQTVPPGSEIAITLEYTIIDVLCPGCIDQIQYGLINADSGVGDPVLGQCIYNGIPGPSGVSGQASLTLTAPTEPGDYAFVFDRAQAFTCESLTGWWNGPPRPVQRVALISVQTEPPPTSPPTTPTPPTPPTTPTPPTPTGLSSIPPLKQLTVQVEETKVLPGRQSTDPTDTHADPNGGIVDEDTIGNFAIAALYNTDVNFYFRDGRFNDNDWQVDRGSLQGSESPLQAYTIHAAQQTHTGCCLGSPHGIFYKFPTQEDYAVYELNGGAVALVATVPAQQIVVDDYTRVANLVVNNTTGTRTLIFAKAVTPISAFHMLGDGIEGATVSETPFGRYVQLRYTVAGKPFDTERDYTAGPDDFENRYGYNRQFFPVTDGNRTGTIWQSRDDAAVYVTWIGPDPAQVETIRLPGPDGYILAAATSDATGTLYLFVVQAGNGEPNGTRAAALLKSAANGTELARVTPDTSKAGLDIVEFGTLEQSRWVASLHHTNGMVALVMGRIQHRSDVDGLNHQAGTAAIYDENTLAELRGPQQTSSHSWENIVTHTQQGQFLVLELADNFPRGIPLHRFDHQTNQSRVVYTFKTEHSTNDTNQPFYRTCASNGKTYIQRSNDNDTYTELGGVTETSQGFVVIFAGERSRLDNCAVGEHLNAPRNIGLVLVRSDFENATRDADHASVVTDDLILTQSDYTVEGEYYNFVGTLKKQRNAGVAWLTDLPADKSRNVSRVKTHPLGDREILILWERWGPKAYQATFAMSVQPNGTIVQAPVELSSLLRLNRRDDLFAHGGHIYSIAGNATSRQLIFNIFVRN